MNWFNVYTDCSKNVNTVIAEHDGYILANIWNLYYVHFTWANIAVLFNIFISGAVAACVIDVYKNYISA